MGAILSAVTGFTLQAATPAAGFALQNGTPSIISWTTPSDGNEHRVLVIAAVRVTSGETGGQVNANGTDPSPAAFSKSVIAGNQGTGYNTGSPVTFIVGPGTTFTVAQGTALSAGAATVWAEIWGS